MAHANLAVCRDSGASVAVLPVFETSPIALRGEVSKSPLDGKRRGGARNRADRESYSLTARQIANLNAAVLQAQKTGLPLNRFITVHWEAAGLPLENMAKATGSFVGRLTEWLRRRGHRTAWIWAHENGSREGGHCHLLVHVPAVSVVDLTKAQARWLRIITGRPYRAGVIKSIAIGRRLDLEVSNPCRHFANLETLVAYVTKQAEASAKSSFHQRGGRVIGKRCGTSQNIGAKARG